MSHRDRLVWMILKKCEPWNSIMGRNTIIVIDFLLGKMECKNDGKTHVLTHPLLSSVPRTVNFDEESGYNSCDIFDLQNDVSHKL